MHWLEDLILSKFFLMYKYIWPEFPLHAEFLIFLITCNINFNVHYDFAASVTTLFRRFGCTFNICALYAWQSELGLIVDLEEPDTTPAPERQKLRKAKEDDKFDDDHYL